MKKFKLSDDLTRSEAVFQSLGAASTCWERINDAGIFESTRAREIGDELMRYLETSAPEKRSLDDTTN